MDQRLVAWARQVKARRDRRGGRRRFGVPLWLFTDAERVPDPCAAALALPRGLAGVVFRPEGVADRHRLALLLASRCRERRLALVVAGDWRLAARCHAGLHLRGGAAPLAPRWLRRATASAHGTREIQRARNAGTPLIFISPVFPTASHPGAAPLGPVRWHRLATLAAGCAGALGGVSGLNVRRLSVCAVAVGAIGAFAPD